MRASSLARLFRRGSLGFETVDSFEAAARLAQAGTLKRVLLIPGEAGGPDAPINVVYVPPQAATHKAAVDGPILVLVAQGHKVHYSASPEYRGRSVVPCRLRIRTSGAFVMEAKTDIW